LSVTSSTDNAGSERSFMSTQKTRRDFLKAAGGTLAAVALSGCAAASAKKSAAPPPAKIGRWLIDAHAHVYANPKIRNTPAGSPFLSAEQQIEIMDRLGIDKAVIMQLNDAEGPAEHQSIGEVLAICDRFPGRFIPFCNFDPRLPKHPDKLETKDYVFRLTQYKDLGCKGFGELTASIPWDHYCMLHLLEACEIVGFPVTFHTMSPDFVSQGFENYGVLDGIGLPRLEKVLQKFPNLKFFGHSMAFWSEISADVTPDKKNIYPDGPVTPGGVVPRLMRQYPNLYGDLSGRSGCNALARDPDHAYKFIDEFQDRLLFALDYCSTKDKRDLPQWLLTAVKDGHITPQIYEKIAWKNINHALSLNLT